MKTFLACLITIAIAASTVIAAEFKGKEVKTRQDVQSVEDYELMKLTGGQNSQIKMLGELVALLYAYMGKIEFGTVGIKGVTDSESADTYISALYDGLWKTRNAIRTEASQIITNQDFK